MKDIYRDKEDQSRIMTTKGLAAHFGVHFITIRNWAKSGKLKYRKPGRSYFFDLDNL